MFCAKCGAKVEDGAKFCPKCGAAVGEAQTAGASATAAKTETAKAASLTANTAAAEASGTAGVTATASGKDKKKVRKGWTVITLEKAGETPIEVECPEKIKRNPALAFLTLRTSGFPQLNVTPKDWKGLGIHVGIFAAVLGVAGIAASEEIIAVAALVGIPGLIYLAIAEANYYFSFIKKHVKTGWEIKDAGQHALCEAAGVFK